MTDREKLIDIILRSIVGLFDRNCAGVIADNLLANGVTVQKHGRWIHKEGEEFSYCSVCNYPVSYMWNMTNYCPNCGVKMGGE